MVDGSSRLEISNNKWPHSQKFQFYSFLNIFYGIWERTLVSPLALSPHLLVTSKLTTRKIFIKDWMASTHERTLTEQHTEYNTNIMCRCIPLYLSAHFIFNTLNVIPHSVFYFSLLKCSFLVPVVFTSELQDSGELCFFGFKKQWTIMVINSNIKLKRRWGGGMFRLSWVVLYHCTDILLLDVGNIGWLGPEESGLLERVFVV